ncbi:uncharacterized protein B0P05DRAFT_566204 [Gilbertella persicaria]|uniref:uncharacterized protein n=1 Tax=Gilbertella persicaria TaxID=101096 RepID=UPI00221FC2F3|nr:uncharacterized protein B0P05DRAFT_566204 [Gilbertella persicaria]KAI8047349.1 hypothetical protein B0P05DRAFT_566204 [Gilbertella persicaria]
MSLEKRKKSPYGPFVEQVFMPSLRLACLLFAVLAIGFASWLETNDSIQDCTFKNSMSFHQIQLYRNISSNVTTPDSVSFGLWKSCYFYALNCTCSPTNLRYQPDIQTLLETAATTHLAKPMSATDSSFDRIIPLVLATIACAIAFFIGFSWAKRRGKYLARRIVAGLLFITLVFVAYAFGSTYDHYYKSIISTCKDPTNTVLCARHKVGTEVILFGIALGCLFIGLLLYLLASGFIYKEEEPEHVTKFDVEGKMARFFRKKNNSKNKTMYSQQDELAAWHDASMFENESHEDFWEEHSSANNSYDPLVYDNKKYHHRKHTKPSQSLLSLQQHQQSSLSPPPPIATSGHRSRTAKHTRRQINVRQESSTTFGGKQRRKSSGRPLSDLEPIYQQQPIRSATRTPTSPYPQNNDKPNQSSSSFCMTPFYVDNEADSPVSSGYFEQQPSSKRRLSHHQFSGQKLPVLNMPPVGMEHPLNKRIVTDKRIQTYLQKNGP